MQLPLCLVSCNRQIPLQFFISLKVTVRPLFFCVSSTVTVRFSSRCTSSGLTIRFLFIFISLNVTVRPLFFLCLFKCNRMISIQVLHLFQRMTDEDAELLWMDARVGRPENLIIENLLVSPPIAYLGNVNTTYYTIVVEASAIRVCGHVAYGYTYLFFLCLKIYSKNALRLHDENRGGLPLVCTPCRVQALLSGVRKISQGDPRPTSRPWYCKEKQHVISVEDPR